MTENGFLHIDRNEILNHPIWKKPNHYFKIFFYLLLTANYKDDELIKRGQAIADLNVLASLCSSGTGKATERYSPESIYRAIINLCTKTDGIRNEFQTINKNKVLVSLSEYDKITNSKLLRIPNESQTNSNQNKSTIIYNNNKNNKQVTSRAESSVKVKPTAFSNFKPRDRDFDKIKQKSKEKLRRKTDE